MKFTMLIALLIVNTTAEECRVLIDGTGCRTRQLAIQRILEKVPGVEDVTILPRKDAPVDNQRYFLVRSKGRPPTREQLVEALGRRAKYYRILTVGPSLGG